MCIKERNYMKRTLIMRDGQHTAAILKDVAHAIMETIGCPQLINWKSLESARSDWVGSGRHEVGHHDISLYQHLSWRLIQKRK